MTEKNEKLEREEKEETVEKAEEEMIKEKPDLMRIGFRCEKAGGIVYAENVNHDFACPSCAAPLHYQSKPMSLTTTSDIKHEIRKVVELSKK